MDAAILLKELQRENPWWYSNKVDEVLNPPFKRSDYYAVVKGETIKSDQCVILTGPRRIGKSTLFFQTINYLITEEKISAKRVLYVDLSRDFFKLDEDVAKRKIDFAIEVYLKDVLQENLSNLNEKVYLFIDEIQEAEAWPNVLKKYFDRKVPIKFFVSGSCSTKLSYDSSSAGVGRFVKQLMLPWKFGDVLRFHKKNSFYVESKNFLLRPELVKAIHEKDSKILFAAFEELQKKLSPAEQENLDICFSNFFVFGGYPEMHTSKDVWLKKSAYLRETILDHIITRDILRVFNIRRPEKIRLLLYALAKRSSQESNLGNLAEEIGLSRSALEDYLSYLEQAHLIRVAHSYKKTKTKATKEVKKMYLSDIGMRNSILGLGEDEIKADSTSLGLIAESIAQDHVLRLKYCLEGLSPEIFYWRKNHKYEVDIVVNLLGELIPIEVKYQSKISKGDFLGLTKFMNSHKCLCGIVLSKNDFFMEHNILVIPLKFFLMLV